MDSEQVVSSATPGKRRWLRRGCLALVLIVVAGFVLPEHAVIPVEGARRADWNPKSFWYEPWGPSGVHKGIDVFAHRGQPVLSAVPGVVIYQGRFGAGGNVVAVLGPRWRIHYYAHLDEPADAPWLVGAGQRIGKVGSSGNAEGKPPHLHYAIISIVPLPWRISAGTQGWRKMFYLDPGKIIAPE